MIQKTGHAPAGKHVQGERGPNKDVSSNVIVRHIGQGRIFAAPSHPAMG